MLSATKGGVPTTANWPNVVRNASQYVFTANFIDEKSSATCVTWEVAQAYLAALKTLGIDAEIVQD